MRIDVSCVLAAHRNNNIIICTKRERLIAQALWNTLNHLILSLLLMYYYPIPVSNATTPLNLIVGSPSLYFMMIRACARCSVLAVAAWHVTSSFVTCYIDVTIVSTFGRRSTYVALSGVVLRQPLFFQLHSASFFSRGVFFCNDLAVLTSLPTPAAASKVQ